MGLFLRITYQSQGGRTPEKALKNRKVLRYIIDGLNDGDWQDSISIKLTTHDPRYSHIAINAILRFFLSEHIIYKSFYRYLKKDDKLIIDQMLTIDKYDNLSESDTRKALCDDIFLYFKEVILKYKDRFLDFDAVAFIPLLETRFNEIKNEELKYYR